MVGNWFAVVKYLITIQNLWLWKKIRRNRQTFEIFFAKFQVPFSQKIFNIHLCISYRAFICSTVWLSWLPNDICFNNQSSHWKTILFVESTKPFISNSVRLHRYIGEILQFYVPEMGLLTPCSVPRGGFSYTMIAPRGEFLLPSSRVWGGWLWMRLILAEGWCHAEKEPCGRAYSRKSCHQRNAAILWDMNVDKRRAWCFTRSQLWLKMKKFFCCMIFNSSWQRIYDNSKGNYLFD